MLVVLHSYSLLTSKQRVVSSVGIALSQAQRDVRSLGSDEYHDSIRFVAGSTYSWISSPTSGTAFIVSASPVAEAVPDPLPLPPLIRSVHGFTDPIGTLAPPLPVLQVPTPAKASPPFTGSDIKPKKIGYFWTAAGDNDHAGIGPSMHLTVGYLTDGY